MALKYAVPTPDQIAIGAYHVWEKESRPLGRQKENWSEAETQLQLIHEEPEATPSIGYSDVTTQTALTMPGIGKRSKTRQPRVLVVDDEPFATHRLGGLLRRYGCIAAELNDPAKALEMARRFQPDIILLDMHMPWKDGHEVEAEFASNKLQCGVPIIFITHDPLDRDKATDSIPILVKPFSIEDLFARLKEAITKQV